MDSVEASFSNGTATKSIEPTPTRKEVLYDGYFYDVTDFVKKHPGNREIF